MPGDFPYQQMTPGQRQVFQDTAAVYREYLENVSQALDFKGGMHWKKIRGREYLYRYRDRLGHGESAGPRSEHTERLFHDFRRERREVMDRVRDLRRLLLEQARFCRAALINRVPRTLASILRRLEQFGAGGNLLVIGAAAIYAYEFAAGAFLPKAAAQELLAEAQLRLVLAVEGQLSWKEVLRVLQQADRSFAELAGEGSRAINRDGFLVCLAKSEVRRPVRARAITVPGAREPLPPEAGQLQYLMASSRFSQVVIGKDGTAATLTVPDPWAYALNRLWWSAQEDREPETRSRDRRRALAVAGLVLRFLPHYDFSPSELDMFPRGLAREAEAGPEEAAEEELMEY